MSITGTCVCPTGQFFELDLVPPGAEPPHNSEPEDAWAVFFSTHDFCALYGDRPDLFASLWRAIKLLRDSCVAEHQQLRHSARPEPGCPLCGGLSVRCMYCQRPLAEGTAHPHNGGWVGYDCCWDKRARPFGDRTSTPNAR